MKALAKILFFFGSFLFLTSTTTCAQSSLELFGNSSEKYKNVKIQEVISPDTVVIENYLRRGERIKLIGLKATAQPKVKKRVERDAQGFAKKEEYSGPITPLEEEALNYVKELIEGKEVNIEFDVNKKNDELYTVAYIFLASDNTFINAEIIRQGYADLQITPPNLKYVDKLRAAYQEARREKRGLQNK